MTLATETPPHVAMFQLLNGASVASAISCLAALGIADLVEAGPQSAAALAAQTGTQPRPLYRLLRAVAGLGILAEGPDDTFSQTPLSSVLRSDADPSLRALAIMFGREWHMRGFQNLGQSVRSGKTAVDEVYGKPLFDYLRETPEEAQIFNAAMTALSTLDGPAVADAYPFDGIRSVVDIAGGHGLLLATLLERHPQLKGTLYDLPHVIEGARQGPLAKVADRCMFASGDMFSSVPAGADAYIMKHILHDWPDERCVQLLRACRKAVDPGGTLLVVDNVIQAGNGFAPGKFLDLAMLVFTGGCERTEKEFAGLFAAAGWRLNRVIPTAAPESVVEGVPA